MTIIKCSLLVSASMLLMIACINRTIQKRLASTNRYIRVSADNAAYFSFSDGSLYFPVGINMISPSGKYSGNSDSAFYEMEQWMKNLSANGGNFIRVWLSNSFWDIEEEAGKYNEEKVHRIDRFIEMARKYHLRIKLTLEHFRSITLKENSQQWATKFAYHTSRGGPLDSVRQYLTSAEGQRLFLNKIDFYHKRYGSDTLFFGWELWNEMNAMSLPKDSVFYDWNEKMLAAVKQYFPEQLVMQSLGSFDGDYVRPVYKKIMSMPANEVAQVHRYLDLGAQLEICHAPMDLICASAVKDLLSYHLAKPVVLAETGAVEPRHAGPSNFYAKDTAGSLLHDILFAPFFSGAAGTGMSWHWESYVHKNNLWYHFKRFNEVIKGIDPIKESFSPSFTETNSLRIYMLKGKRTTLLWLRDKSNNWESEFQKGMAPQILHRVNVNLAELGITSSVEKIDVYDPWKNIWTSVEKDSLTFDLPDFKRSITIKIISK
ncbi:MAG: cellulase family glycosylhydrolase [Chitinophagaceae bacterium]